MTRQWLDHARKAKQTVSSEAAGGTFAAGVFHVTELLPSFMTDTLNNAPEDQKVRTLENLLRNDPLEVNILDRVLCNHHDYNYITLRTKESEDFFENHKHS